MLYLNPFLQAENCEQLGKKMKTLAKQTLLTEYIIIIASLSVCLFLYGFFPIKSSSELFSSEEDFPKTLFDTK